MKDIDNLEEINLLPDQAISSAKFARSNQRNWRKFAVLQRPKWKRQLASSHAGSAKARKRDK